MRARAAMLMMMGLARTQPIRNPCSPVSSEPNISPMSSPGPKPSRFAARMNTIAVTPTVAPSANDMMFPLMVTSVMPIATQPMNDTVVRSDRMLGPDKKPGVARITATRMTMPIACTHENSEPRSRWVRSEAALTETGESVPVAERSVMQSTVRDA
jgi:hypothetical protein